MNSCQDELRRPQHQSTIASAESTFGIGVQLGELLPITWRAAFHCLFRPSLACWNSVKEFETFRQQVRALFYTVREAMDGARKIAAMLEALTGRQPAGLGRLLKAIEEARELEEQVFRDWPSFVEPRLTSDSLPVDEALAECLDITVDEARQKMAARRHQLNAKPE